MGSSKTPTTLSFVVRFVDTHIRDQNNWRGQVEHVQSGEKRFFRSGQHLLQLMDELRGQQTKKSSQK